MKRIFIIIISLKCLITGTKVSAQTDISMATHWYNRSNYNPASITKTEYIYLFTNARRQWYGVNGTPAVFNVQASGYIHSLRSAFGISLVSDQIGVTKSLNPMLSYAYRIGNDMDESFSMGISAGIFSRSIDGSRFEAENISDPMLYYDIERIIRPDANIGFEYQNRHLIVGFSSTHLFSFANDASFFLNTNHRYGYVIYKNTDSELLNYNMGLQIVNRYNIMVLEGNASIRFKHPTGLSTGPREMFDIGITYRSSQQLTFLFGLNISSNLRIGYAYDRSFLSGYIQNSTHEIMIEYRIPSKKSSVCIHCRNNDYWYY